MRPTLDRAAKFGKTADEIAAEKLERARGIFTSAQIHNWESKAREDAEVNKYAPPSPEELLLGIDVYQLAYSRRKYKIAKAKREAG